MFILASEIDYDYQGKQYYCVVGIKIKRKKIIKFKLKKFQVESVKKMLK